MFGKKNVFVFSKFVNVFKIPSHQFRIARKWHVWKSLARTPIAMGFNFFYSAFEFFFLHEFKVFNCLALRAIQTPFGFKNRPGVPQAV